MKRTVQLLALATALSIPLFAHAQGMSGMDMKHDKGMNGMAHHASGTVKKVDRQEGAVTVAHGPVQSLKWPAMTMTFKVKEKKMLDKVKEGDPIDFTFVQSGKDYTITAVK